MYLTFLQAIAQIHRQAETGLGFIATAATHWHALGVDAFVDDLRAKGHACQGTVLLMAHPTNGMLLSASNLPICAEHHDIQILQVGGRLPKSVPAAATRSLQLAARGAWLMLRRSGKLNSGDAVLRIASPRLPDAFTLLHLSGQALQRRQIEFVVLDEGLSSYLPATVAGQVRRPDRVASRTGVGIREFELLLRRTYDKLHGVFSGRFATSERLLFQPGDGGQLTADKQIAASYRVAAAQHMQPSETLPRDPRPLAILLPQPWSEIGETDPAIEANLFREVAADLQQRGFTVAIKPHPRETQGKYGHLNQQGVATFTQGIPVETLFSQLRPHDLVLGHNTTSLLTAAALSPATAATLGNLLIQRRGAGRVFLAFQQHFDRLAGDQVIDAQMLFSRSMAA